RLRSDDTAVYY
nr:immunoglobulin heavy chain junction region [Homo sapiens]